MPSDDEADPIPCPPPPQEDDPVAPPQEQEPTGNAPSPRPPSPVTASSDLPSPVLEYPPPPVPAELTAGLAAESSAATTPTTTVPLLPPPAPSVSPAPTTKKFASSLSVNKKFLEKAGDKGKPEVKAAVARLAAPPVVAPVSTSHPRLLTGKISAGTSVSLTTAQTTSGVSGWTKTGPAVEGAPRPPLPTQQDAISRAGTYERGQGMSGFGQATRGKNGAVWGARGAVGEAGLHIGGDFPTAAEAANAKHLRAAALLEQMQSRDRAVQARAAAAAAANAHLLEGLDAFRGVHLDPNASHWDEMGDEDNDFLDDTIEFGDGTQYKIDAETHADESLAEPHPSDFATLEAPLDHGELVPELSREERFKDDFDRTWSKRSSVGDEKNLFNDRLGKFEPYAGSGRKPGGPEPEAPKSLHRPPGGRAPGPEHPPHGERQPGGRRESITSPRLEKAVLPPSTRREGAAWSRESGRATDWVSGGVPAPHLPSVEPKPRRTSIEQPTALSARRPSIDQGGRQLPPHLTAAPPPRSSDRLDPVAAPRHPISPPTGTPSALPSQPPTASIAAPPTAEVVEVEPASVAAPPPVVPDLQELHAREMHAAAERAKKRRQEEEQLRVEQAERAKKKAAEIEEKLRLAAQAKAEAAAAVAPPAPDSKGLRQAANGLPPPTGADRAESWRKPVVAVPPPPAAKPEPTKILARETPLKATSDSTTPSSRAAASATAVAVPLSDLPPPARRGGPSQAVLKQPAPVEDRIWRRPESRPTPQSTAEATRAPPPHLATRASSARELESLPDDALPPRSVPNLDAAKSQFADSPSGASSKPPRGQPNGPPTATTPPSPHIPQGVPSKSPVKRARPMSTLDDVLSRIKGAMAVVPPAKDDEAPAPETNVPSSDGSPILAPTVKLPTSTLIPGAGASRPPPSLSPELSKPATAVASVATARPPPTHIPTVPRGRGTAIKRPPGYQALAFESREPEPHFEKTRLERSPSPPPAWKAFPVRLAGYAAHAPPTPSLLAAFNHKDIPARVQVLSWTPPIPNLNPRRMSRDDLFFPKSFARGVLLAPVNIPRYRITRRTTIEAAPSLPQEAASSAAAWRRDASLIAAGDRAGDGGKSGGDLNATTAPPAESLFDQGPQRPRSLKSKTTATSRLAFYSQPEDYEPAEASETPRVFMVTSELNGEVVEPSPRESLTAPGADTSRRTPPPETLPPSSFEGPDPSNSSPLSPPAAAPWMNISSPLTLSVLDPTAPSVWSAPPADAPVHTRSISLGGAQPENSLQGISDPDDFPAASIPTSLADLKSEDEASNEEEKKDDPKPVPKDEARLRAAAPSFSSYSDSHPATAQPRYPSFTRPQSQPPAHSVSPINYSAQPFLPSQPPMQQQYGHYASFGPSPGQMNAYATPMHQSYQASLFPSAHSPASQSFTSYRAPAQQITNPALIASGYGYGAIGTHGVVGAGSSPGTIGRGATPSITPGYLQSPYQTGQQLPYRIQEGFGDVRSPYGGSGSFSIGVGSPSMHPASLYQQQASLPQGYSGAFSPQLATAIPPGGIARHGGDPQRQRRQFN